MRRLSNTDQTVRGAKYALRRQMMINLTRKTYVAVLKGRVVGTASIFIEMKLMGHPVGHIEDVVVEENVERHGVGRALINRCVKRAKEVYECYKVILDCADHNVGFYEKCGFHKKEVCMRLDLS